MGVRGRAKETRLPRWSSQGRFVLDGVRRASSEPDRWNNPEKRSLVGKGASQRKSLSRRVVRMIRDESGLMELTSRVAADGGFCPGHVSVARSQRVTRQATVLLL